jgi:hypothetical protein
MSTYKGHRFSAYDGESIRDHYVLLANDRGESVENLDGLTTAECLEFLARPTPKSRSETRLIFGSSFDVAHWVKDFTAEQRERLYAGERVTFERWTVEYLPRRLFVIYDHETPNKPQIKYHDVSSWFQGSFLDAVTEWIGEPPALLVRGKRERGTWRHWSLARIRSYNLLECELLVQLVLKMDAGLKRLSPPITLRSWYGPGAAASWLLNHAPGLYTDFRYFSPEHVGDGLLDPMRRAYFGGRIELTRLGTVKRLYRYDINSAYPWALSHLYTLTYQWTLVTTWTAQPQSQMSIWRVSWRLPPGSPLGPFPFRETDGLISYPLTGEGWYWWPEVSAALRSFGARAIRVDHGYVNIGDEYSVLRELVHARYLERQALRAAGDPAERLLKLAMNAMYGKFIQRLGSGRWYCLPWAGWATSLVRARLLAAVRGREHHVVSFSTDGIVTDAPLTVKLADHLGGWDEAYYSSGTFVLPGLYRLQPPKGHQLRHTRSYDPSHFSWPSILRQLEASGTAQVPVSIFVGHQLADQQPDYADRRLQFVSDTLTLDPAAIARKRLGASTVGPGFRWARESVELGALPWATLQPPDGLSVPCDVPDGWDRSAELLGAGEHDAAL